MNRTKSPDQQKPPPETRTIGDRFRIVREIGHGAAGTVYEGVQLSVDRRVAIKVLHQSRQRQEDYEERFTREAKAIARLSHSNCITLYDFGYSEEFQSLFMVMEFIDGKELFELTKDKVLPLNTALRVSIQIAEAVAHAHKHGILHRDLKPENVLVNKDWDIKVLDFGLARMLDLFATESGRRLTAEGAVFGTPAYMSPEQCSGDLDVTVQSDIYSLGIMLYELFEGRLPFDSKEVVKILVHHAKDPPPPITRRIPERISHLIFRMLEKQPTKRPRTATEVADTLRAVLVAVASDDANIDADVSQEIQRSLVRGIGLRDETGEGMRISTEDGLEQSQARGFAPSVPVERLPTVDLVGHRIGGHYTMGEKIAQDPVSSVFAGSDAAGSPVAIRIVGQRVADAERTAPIMSQELGPLKTIKHRNIAEFRDVGHDPGHDRMFFVTEAVPGDQLSQLCDAGRAATELALLVAADISAALATVHAKGIVHGDVQPSSILLSPQANELVVAKLTRFGLARLIQPNSAAAALFRSPEQLRGKQPEAVSDIYSLGVVLYQMLAGHVPWEGKTFEDLRRAVLRGGAPTLSDFVQEVPRGLSDLVQQMMSLNPSQRPRTAAQVADQVDRLRQQLGSKDFRVAHTGAATDVVTAWRLRRRVPIPVRDSSPSVAVRSTSQFPAIGEEAAEQPTSRAATVAVVFMVIAALIVVALVILRT